jgi:NDP-sugar pyrophosphorylase family protein
MLNPRWEKLGKDKKPVGLGVIIILGTRFLSGWEQNSPGSFLEKPFCCVDVLGRPTIERMLEQFLRLEVEQATILTPAPCSRLIPPMRGKYASVKVKGVSDLSSAVTQVLNEYSQTGIENCFLISGSLYTETDLLDLFFFHREAMRPVTRAITQHGPLDLWVVECDRASHWNLENLLTGRRVASYLIGGYVRRLDHPRDLRCLIADALSGHCGMRPLGREVRPGIWIDEGADVDRLARIVAPAYIGRRSKVKEDALITRCSSIEHDCSINYGTVIENSSILAHTSVGIWLDVRHAVASGDRLFSLSRGVTVEISDPSVMRSNVPVREVRAPVLELAHSTNGKHEPEIERQPLVGRQQRGLAAGQVAAWD